MSEHTEDITPIQPTQPTPTAPSEPTPFFEGEEMFTEIPGDLGMEAPTDIDEDIESLARRVAQLQATGQPSAIQAPPPTPSVREPTDELERDPIRSVVSPEAAARAGVSEISFPPEQRTEVVEIPSPLGGAPIRVVARPGEDAGTLLLEEFRKQTEALKKAQEVQAEGETAKETRDRKSLQNVQSLGSEEDRERSQMAQKRVARRRVVQVRQEQRNMQDRQQPAIPFQTDFHIGFNPAIESMKARRLQRTQAKLDTRTKKRYRADLSGTRWKRGHPVDAISPATIQRAFENLNVMFGVDGRDPADAERMEEEVWKGITPALSKTVQGNLVIQQRRQLERRFTNDFKEALPNFRTQQDVDAFILKARPLIGQWAALEAQRILGAGGRGQAGAIQKRFQIAAKRNRNQAIAAQLNMGLLRRAGIPVNPQALAAFEADPNNRPFFTDDKGEVDRRDETVEERAQRNLESKEAARVADEALKEKKLRVEYDASGSTLSFDAWKYFKTLTPKDREAFLTGLETEASIKSLVKRKIAIEEVSENERPTLRQNGLSEASERYMNREPDVQRIRDEAFETRYEFEIGEIAVIQRPAGDDSDVISAIMVNFENGDNMGVAIVKKIQPGHTRASGIKRFDELQEGVNRAFNQRIVAETEIIISRLKRRFEPGLKIVSDRAEQIPKQLSSASAARGYVSSELGLTEDSNEGDLKESVSSHLIKYITGLGLDVDTEEFLLDAIPLLSKTPSSPDIPPQLSDLYNALIAVGERGMNEMRGRTEAAEAAEVNRRRALKANRAAVSLELGPKVIPIFVPNSDEVEVRIPNDAEGVVQAALYKTSSPEVKDTIKAEQEARLQQIARDARRREETSSNLRAAKLTAWDDNGKAKTFRNNEEGDQARRRWANASSTEKKIIEATERELANEVADLTRVAGQHITRLGKGIIRLSLTKRVQGANSETLREVVNFVPPRFEEDWDEYFQFLRNKFSAHDDIWSSVQASFFAAKGRWNDRVATQLLGEDWRSNTEARNAIATLNQSGMEWNPYEGTIIFGGEGSSKEKVLFDTVTRLGAKPKEISGKLLEVTGVEGRKFELSSQSFIARLKFENSQASQFLKANPNFDPVKRDQMMAKIQKNEEKLKGIEKEELKER